MYQRILVPWDGSRECEAVAALVRRELAPDGDLILLHVIPSRAAKVMEDESESFNAVADLRWAVQQPDGHPGQFQAARCDVVVAESASRAIADFAKREQVDLIAMYIHDRNVIAGLIRRIIARDLQQKAPIDVKAFSPSELAGVASAEVGGAHFQ